MYTTIRSQVEISALSIRRRGATERMRAVMSRFATPRRSSFALVKIHAVSAATRTAPKTLTPERPATRSTAATRTVHSHECEIQDPLSSG